jgi:formyltetrahydrofolate synthetase
MVQSADIKPAESAYNAVNSGCNSIAKNIAAWNKFNAETLPALNKLLKDQKVEALPVAAVAPAPPPCAK